MSCMEIEGPRSRDALYSIIIAILRVIKMPRLLYNVVSPHCCLHIKIQE
jgi:hypothetical protein